jgi:hypothetical protein
MAVIQGDCAAEPGNGTQRVCESMNWENTPSSSAQQDPPGPAVIIRATCPREGGERMIQ